MSSETPSTPGRIGDRLLSRQEAADFAGVSVDTIDAYRKDGLPWLPATPGKRAKVRIWKSDLVAYLARLAKRAGKSPPLVIALVLIGAYAALVLACRAGVPGAHAALVRITPEVLRVCDKRPGDLHHHHRQHVYALAAPDGPPWTPLEGRPALPRAGAKTIAVDRYLGVSPRSPVRRGRGPPLAAA